VVSARDILSQMGLEFNRMLEENGITEAWKMRQRRLNEHMGILSEVMSVKDIMEETRRIGEYLKSGSGGGAGGTESPLDAVREFLDDKPGKPN
jgi:hypothetical protein